MDKFWKAIMSMQSTSEEFIKEARRFQKEIEASKLEKVGPLKVKEIWKERLPISKSKRG